MTAFGTEAVPSSMDWFGIVSEKVTCSSVASQAGHIADPSSEVELASVPLLQVAERLLSSIQIGLTKLLAIIGYVDSTCLELAVASGSSRRDS